MSGFNIKNLERVGRWKMAADGIDFSIDKKWAKHPSVYVFVDNANQVLYVGRTILSLEDALNRIKRGYVAQVTNHRIHNHLVEHLKKGHSAEIFTYVNSESQADPISFLDGYKTELLRQVSPLWNIQ